MKKTRILWLSLLLVLALSACGTGKPIGDLLKGNTGVSGQQETENPGGNAGEFDLDVYKRQGQNPDAWPQSDKLKLIQSNIASVQAKLNAAKAEQQAKEQAAKEEKAACTCPSCGHENPEGVKFCQECGTKLGGSAKKHCTSCGEMCIRDR